MTIEVHLYDGRQLRTLVYRKVYKGRNYAQHVESFYSLRDTYKWGVLEQLKGKQVIKLHEFGSPHG